MADQDLDRNHPATTYKLDQARRKGSVARSQDVSAVAMLAVMVVACHVLAVPFIQQWAQLSRRWWSPGTWMTLDLPHASALMSGLVLAALTMLAPLLIAIAFAAVFSHLLQSGPVLSAEPLKPDFTRLSLTQGFKRLFSLKTIYVAGKSLVKLTLLAGVFWWAFEALLGSFLALAWLPAKAQALRLPSFMGGMLTKLWLVLLILALIDLMYTRWEFARQMRMSARELKDEFKHREGDPRVRRRLRELRIERLKQSRAMGQVASADVVVTNPTRVAVALRYDREREAAPTVLAKGAGTLAARMRELAYRNSVPVVQNPPLARALYRRTQIGGLVPEEWYPVAAKILVWVYASRNARRQGGTA